MDCLRAEADAVLIAHAYPGSRTAALAEEACLAAGVTLFAAGSVLLTGTVFGNNTAALLAAALAGACLGFLWYNTYPAQVFMGDVGSLALGGGLGTLAVLTKNELLSIILGGIFVVEAVSVILQVGYFRMTGRRIFLMAPIHHHFEKKGWPEPRVIVRFWIIAIMTSM